MNAWKILPIVALGFACSQPEEIQPPTPKKPNFIVIFCDDVGYGDIGAFGHPTIKTPRLDRMAVEGQKWTNFYVGASVCTPSRYSLLTGRLPIRGGMNSTRRVFFPDSGGGIQDNEITLAEALRELGYATAHVGKWHLGHLPQFLPTEHGFDSYFGIPYSNDMDRVPESPRGRAAFDDPKNEYWNVPLMRDKEIIERPADQTTLTKRYTEEAVKFIRSHSQEPFFIYLAHSMAHVPLFRSEEFQDTSLRGLYGDVIEEIDWSVGQILDVLKELRLDDNTYVVFSSDNGPWLTYFQQGGSAGLLRGGKGDTFEGGMREPTIFWGPGRVVPGVVTDMGATMDLLPTFLSLAGGSAPGDRAMDGYDLTNVLQDRGPTPRDMVFYYREGDLFAVRYGPFKAHFITRSGYGRDKRVLHDPPLLYHLEHDPSEKYDVGEENAGVIQEIKTLVEEHKNTIEPVTDQLLIRIEQ